jgi:cell wall-associated NlpC family hydrolase
MGKFFGWFFAAGILMLAASCASAPVKPVTGYTPAIGEKAAKTAVSMTGRPYKFKGDSPEGFDCSGLVQYSYLSAGLEVPHGTSALRRVTKPVGLKSIRTGDLLFFNESGKKASHVGIFLGGNLFIHAPSTGGKVRKESLADPYWKKSFLDARRFM